MALVSAVSRLAAKAPRLVVHGRPTAVSKPDSAQNAGSRGEVGDGDQSTGGKRKTSKEKDPGRPPRLTPHVTDLQRSTNTAIST